MHRTTPKRTRASFVARPALLWVNLKIRPELPFAEKAAQNRTKQTTAILLRLLVSAHD